MTNFGHNTKTIGKTPSFLRNRFPPMARSLSDVQEAAQLLAGEAMPLSVLSALLGRTAVGQSTNTVIVLVNLTTYDGWTERVCKSWSEGGLKFKTISFSKSLTIAQYVEKALALELMEDMFLPSSRHSAILPGLVL